jgi:hypothetical protein
MPFDQHMPELSFEFCQSTLYGRLVNADGSRRG